ncbi:MAG: putative S-layer protein [Nanoarchaeota archaeon]
MITEKMRNKLLSLFAFSIFALVFVMSAVSAVTLAEWPLTSDGSPVSVVTNLTAGTFTNSSGISQVTFSAVNGATSSEWSTDTINNSEYFEVIISPQTGNNLLISQISFNYSRSDTGPVNYTFQWDDNAAFSSPITISTGNPNNITEQTATSSLSISASASKTIYLRWFAYNAGSSLGTFRVKSLNIQGTVTPIITPITEPSEITACSAIGNPGELKVKKIDFKNNGLSSGVKFGDDNEWFPFEELEVEIQLKNEGNDNIDDISVEWGIWDIKAQNWIIDLDEEDEINIKDGDTETITATFTIDDDLDVDLEDLTDGENYRFYVVATGTVDNDTSPETCISDYEKSSIIIESDFVIVDNIQMPETVRCGETVTVTADVWNIGDRDQDEVSVRITNKELNLAENVIVGDINAFDNERISFSFTIPKDAEEKTYPYPIMFKVYDEDGDVYVNDFDDDYSEFAFPLSIEGSCTGTSSSVTVTANLVSGGKAGEDLVVKAIITNSGTSLATYSISASGYGQWASSYDVEPKTLALAAGQLGEVLFTFNVNKDASGEQTFMIEIVSGDEITTQPVSILIEPSGSLFGITGFSIAGNTGLWALGFLNIILVLIIIFVAIRITRKK